MTEANLLPPEGATPFEIAQEEADASRWPLPVHLIKDVWNPATCPYDLLPYLAAGLGLEIWRDEWGEARARAIVAAIWRLKRNKTKLKGIAGYLRLEDARLVSAHRPRDKFWWGRSPTQAEIAATIADMPQIRIPVQAPPGRDGHAKAFWSGRHIRQAWRPGRFWFPADAAQRAVRRAVYVDRGVTTPVLVRGLDGPLDASLRVSLSVGASRAKVFWGARHAWGAGAAWFTSDAAVHVLTLTPSAEGGGFAVPTGLVPSKVRPERITEHVLALPGQRFWGARGLAGLAWGARGAWLQTDASAHVYDRVTLLDARRRRPGPQPYSFWGWSRFAAPKFTAELRIDIRLTRPPLQHSRGRPWGTGFWLTADMGPAWRAIGAVKLSQAHRDTAWVDLRQSEPIRFVPGLRFGDAAFQSFGDQRNLP